MANYEIGTSPVVNLHPSWDMAENETILTGVHSTLNRADVRYKFGSYKFWTVPLRFLTSSDSQVLNDAWKNQETVTWTVDSSAHNVRIINDQNPVAQLEKPYFDQFRALLKLQEV